MILKNYYGQKPVENKYIIDLRLLFLFLLGFDCVCPDCGFAWIKETTDQAGLELALINDGPCPKCYGDVMENKEKENKPSTIKIFFAGLVGPVVIAIVIAAGALISEVLFK